MVQVMGFIPPEEVMKLKEKHYTFTPEQAAAVFARFSRNKEGLEAIVRICEKVKDPKKIFDYADFGHSSIRDLSGMIPIVFEDEMMLLIYTVFNILYVVSGCESSSRYIDFEGGKVASFEEIVGKDKVKEHSDLELLYNKYIQHSSEAYAASKKYYFNEAEKLPSSHFGNETNPKKLQRYYKNYVFDRIRCFLTSTCYTSAVIMTTAREWNKVIKTLKSYDIFALKNLGERIESNIKKIVPKLVGHTEPDDISKFSSEYTLSCESDTIISCGVKTKELPYGMILNNNVPQKYCSKEFIKSLTRFRNNRYDILPRDLDVIPVGYEFIGPSFGIMRDLNRNRISGRSALMLFNGFHSPDVISTIQKEGEVNPLISDAQSKYFKLMDTYMNFATKMAMKKLHWFSMLLGTQGNFRRSNNLRGVMYEIELRSGTGSDQNYAKYYKILYKKVVEQYGAKILLGEAEPEVV